jgi:hypothetical protein
MNSLQFAWKLILEPTAAFQSLKEKPHFWFPLILVVVLTALGITWYYAVVDFDWLREQVIASNPRTAGMSEAERARAGQFMTKSVLMWGALIGTVLMIPVLRLLEAIYYLLVGKATRVEGSLKQWIAVACWSGFPAVLIGLLMLLSILLRSSAQMSPDAINPLSLNELLLHLPLGHRFQSLASGITVLSPYMWWLTIVGVKVMSGRSMLYSSMVVLVPLVLIYGGWAAFASLF